MNFPGGWELILVLLVVLVVFGSKRLPDSARALGRSLRIFKAETKGLRGDDAEPPALEQQQRFDPYTGKPIEPPTGSESPR
ncbi:MAG TPA: Sec-independent protein translocase subunit TatA [Mycobacteriales bacterium]|nr:Sec-independent protein translocase subunit TatA [Mycobacteriales bacterium]